MLLAIFCLQGQLFDGYRLKINFVKFEDVTLYVSSYVSSPDPVIPQYPSSMPRADPGSPYLFGNA
jgi:hypothetical protein